MGAVKRSNSRKDSENSSGGKERRDSENSVGKDVDNASPPEAKKAKQEETTAKSNPLGALAGLGDYSSSEEDD